MEKEGKGQEAVGREGGWGEMEREGREKGVEGVGEAEKEGG